MLIDSIGKLFAYQELRLLIATLLLNYDIKLAPGSDIGAFEGAIKCRELFYITEPLSVIFTKRAA